MRLCSEQACALADLIERLEASLTEDGTMVKTEAGQPKLNPAASLMVQARVKIAALLAQVDLGTGQAANAQTPRQLRAVKAANSRPKKFPGSQVP